jgi:hypothetical protein
MIKKINSITPMPVPIVRVPLDSEETKAIRKIGNEIKNINNQTEYIKKTGEQPPVTPDYYRKKINII